MEVYVVEKVKVVVAVPLVGETDELASRMGVTFIFLLISKVAVSLPPPFPFLSLFAKAY